MKVILLNPEVVRDLYKNHGEFACVCYDTPVEQAEKVGASCQASGHMSGSRCEYIKFRIDDIDRGTAEQCMRHEIGVNVPFEDQDNYSFADAAEAVADVSPDQIVKNMASFRYIDKTGFKWVTPAAIAHNDEAKELFDDAMNWINNRRACIKEILGYYGVDPAKATEAVNLLLPRAVTSSLVIGFTPEALIHFCHKRLCKRAQEFIQQVAQGMKQAVAEQNPRFAEELVPHCEYLLWCPEGKRSCGRAHTREQLKDLSRFKDEKKE